MVPWADGCHRTGRVHVTVRVCQAGSVLCGSQSQQAESRGEGLGCLGHPGHKPGSWGQKPWGQPSRCSPAGATWPRPPGPCGCCRPCCGARSQAPRMSQPGVAAGTRKPRAVGGDVMTSACQPVSSSAGPESPEDHLPSAPAGPGTAGGGGGPGHSVWAPEPGPWHLTASHRRWLCVPRGAGLSAALELPVALSCPGGGGTQRGAPRFPESPRTPGLRPLSPGPWRAQVLAQELGSLVPVSAE